LGSAPEGVGVQPNTFRCTPPYKKLLCKAFLERFSTSSSREIEKSRIIKLLIY